MPPDAVLPIISLGSSSLISFAGIMYFIGSTDVGKYASPMRTHPPEQSCGSGIPRKLHETATITYVLELYRVGLLM